MIDTESKNMIAKFDDGDGKISYEEFERIFAERSKHLKVAAVCLQGVAQWVAP